MKNNKGITLIALVITIIILIILAGISISILTGQDGMIAKTKAAKQNMENATIEEQDQLNTLYGSLATETGSESITSHDNNNSAAQTELNTLKTDIDTTTATADDILIGKTAYTRDGLVTGNIPIGDNIESVTTWSTYNGKDSFTIPRGYYDGTKQVALGKDSNNKYYNQVEVFDRGLATQAATLSYSFTNLDVNKKYIAILAAHKETGSGGWYAPSITSSGTTDTSIVLGNQVADKNGMYTCQATYFFTPTQTNVTISFVPTTNGNYEWTGVCHVLSY